MKTYFQHTQNEEGFTLVELLVSFVLITILLSTFFMMFAQAGKTNVSSENIVDDTYIAQSEMERIYGKSKSIAPDKKLTAFPTSEYSGPTNKNIEGTEWLEFIKLDHPDGIYIKVRLENTPEKVSRIIIEVLDEGKANPTVKMENVLIWEGA